MTSFRNFFRPFQPAPDEPVDLTPAQIDSVMDSIYQRGDHMMKIFVFVHMLLALAFAPRYGTWLITLTVGPAAVLMFLIAVTLAPKSFFTRVICGIVLQTFVALHIYQFHGLAEMHFFFFTAFTMMIVYCDWISMWPGAVLIIAQHILFAVLHNSGVKLYFFEDRYVGVIKLSFHFGIAIGQVAICGFWAHLLRNRAFRDFAQREAISASHRQLAKLLTETQSSREQLQQKTAILRSVLHHIADAVIVADGRRVIISNPAANRIFGLPNGGTDPELLGQQQGSLSGLLPATDLPLSRVLEDADVDDIEIYVRSPGSARGYWLNVNGRPMRDEQGTVTAVLVCRDVTERKNAERILRESHEQLVRAQKLETAGLLAGGIAHDFNNLLTVIRGYGDLLLRDQPKGSSGRKLVERILFASSRATTLTSHLLTFSNRIVVQPQAIDLNRSVGALEDMLHRILGEGVELSLDLDKSIGAVYVDPGQIDQVILSLALNSRDAMLGSGRLTIRTFQSLIESPTAQPGVTAGYYVVLEVEDTGHGMTPEIQARIFEPFYTTKERGSGTGLGLSIVYGIAQQAGGHVSVRSEPGNGAILTVYLPRVGDVPALLGEPAQSTSGVNGSETILLVEDEEPLRALVEEILVDHGYQVLAAVDGEDGLRVGRSHSGPIDLVITDVVMPRLKGPDMIRRLQAMRHVGTVLYMSGYVDTALEYFQQGRHQGAFIAKPFTPEELLAKVQDTLRIASRA